MEVETDKTIKGNKCDCCMNIIDINDNTLYSYECKHQTCQDCLHNNLIASSFKGIGLEDINITCQVCHNGKMSMKMELIIEILNHLLEKNTEKDGKIFSSNNNMCIINNKRICVNHSIECKSYCKTCHLWLCSECLKQYHYAYYPTHVIIEDELQAIEDKENNNMIEIERCSDHNDFIVSSFCLKCQYEICSKCLVNNQPHFLHRHISLEDKYRHDHLNYTKFQSYEDFLNFIEQNENNFFGKIENDFIIQKTNIDKFVDNLNDIFSNYTSQMEIFRQRMKAIYQVIKLSYHNYFEIMNSTKGHLNSSKGMKMNMFGLSKSLTDIILISQKIIDIEGLNAVLNNQNMYRNEKIFNYDIIWNNNEISKLHKKENCHSDGITRIVELKYSKGFATASMDSTIKIWEYAKEDESDQLQKGEDNDKRIEENNKNINPSYSPDEKEYPFEETARIGSTNGNIPSQLQVNERINNMSNSSTNQQQKSLKSTQTLKGHKGGIWALIETADGCLISGSSDKTIKIWVLKETKSFTLKGHKKIVFSLVELPNNQLASGSEDKTIKIWDRLKKTLLFTLNGHKGKITVLNLLLDGFLISGSDDNSLMIWNLTEQMNVGKLIGHGCTVWCSIAFDDGVIVASGSSDNNIKLWNLNEMKCFMTLEGHDNTISNLLMMKNGYLASCSWDASVKFWDLNIRMCVYTIKEHNGIIWDIIEVSDGTIMTVSNDKSIIIWNKN